MANPIIPKFKFIGGYKPINTPTKKLKVLKRTLKILGENGEHWTKRKIFGRKVRKPRFVGAPVPSTGAPLSEADTFCLVGAMQKAARELGHAFVFVEGDLSIQGLVKNETRFDNVEDWNDARERKFPEVKELVERRIEQLEAEKARGSRPRTT